jgi:hypothetical protein
MKEVPTPLAFVTVQQPIENKERITIAEKSKVNNLEK